MGNFLTLMFFCALIDNRNIGPFRGENCGEQFPLQSIHTAQVIPRHNANALTVPMDFAACSDALRERVFSRSSIRIRFGVRFQTKRTLRNERYAFRQRRSKTGGTRWQRKRGIAMAPKVEVSGRST